MSSMLEQAIVDAQALREAALKNAEQALIEKFAPQIKEAVESLLESDSRPSHKKVKYEGQIYSVMEVENGKYTLKNESTKPFIVSESECSELNEEDLLQEEEMGMEEEAEEVAANIEAPFAGNPMNDPKQKVELVIDIEGDNFEIDIDQLKKELGGSEMSDASMEGPADLAGDLGLGGEEMPAEETGEMDLGIGEEEPEEELVQEIMNLMNEMYNESFDVLEEELTVDVSEQKHGWVTTDEGTRKYDEDLQKAQMKSDELEEENKELKESIKHLKHKNLQYKDAVEKLSQKLNETLLSNAKLLYSNKTLGDASLNERQKNKIVEAIAKARTPEEAKNLCETLNATVTSGTDNKSPRTLSESVQRKSTLSGILPRKTQVEESPELTFAEKMKKLAGIK